MISLLFWIAVLIVLPLFNLTDMQYWSVIGLVLMARWLR